jgi:hypothetical protein
VLRSPGSEIDFRLFIFASGAYVPAMNGFAVSGRSTLHLGVVLGLAMLWIGCVSNKIDWNSRLGLYTFDQAVVELGPPDKSATLSDGTVVAEWMTRRGSAGGYSDIYYGAPRPYPYWRGYYPPAYYYDPPSPAYFLRLVFDPEGRLTDWRKLAR